MSARSIIAALLAGAAFLAAAAAPIPAAAERPAGLDKINHIIVIYLENRSFDNLFGRFPRANGLGRASNTAPQVNADGQPYARLPQPVDSTRKPPAADRPKDW
jgi:phospholipase C